MAIIVGPKGLQEAACFYAKLLGIDSLDFNLEITRKHLDNYDRGICMFDKDTKEAWIELDKKQSSISIYSVLAHEMAHLKQYVTGELEDIRAGVAMWYGKEIICDYWDAPWEIDAYGRQPGLYARWQEFKERQL